MTTTLYSWLLLAKISHLLVGNFTPFQKFMNFLDDIINRVCENSELPNICGEKTKVVDNFYLRLRNEFQPFPAKNQAIDWLTITKQVNQLEAWYFCGKWLELISLSQIESDYYNFSE